MKVYFFLVGSGNSTTLYSDRMFANSLKKKGYDVDIIYNLDEKYKILENCDADIIFFQKTFQCPAHTKKYIEHLKGKVFLCHIDDDFQDMVNVTHIDTINMTDLILVGTEPHKRALVDYTDRPVETISCLIDDENYPYTSPASKTNNPLIISWQQSCADAYINDLLSISNVLTNLHNKYDFTLNLYGWHMGIDYRDLRAPIIKALPFANLIPYKPMQEYLTTIVPELGKSDIFLCPYIEKFDRIGKSGFSLKRVMTLGVPVIVTNTEHHSTIVKDGINGYLAGSEEEWTEKLEKLIVDASLRNSFSINAKNTIDSYYNEDAVIGKLIANVQKYFPEFLP